MRELRFGIDPCNPGQFYACCGLFELSGEGTMAHFVCDEARPRAAEFIVSGAGIADAQEFLRRLREIEFAAMEVAEASIDPIKAKVGDWEDELDWWLDEFREKATGLKCWAGQVTTRKLFEELSALIDPETAAGDPMKFPGMTKSKFGADPRSAWNALDFGYSPNVHNQDAVTYPAVEILAAIGLQGFRPNAQQRAAVEYSLWTAPLPLAVARTAATAPWDGLPHYRYTFAIEKRGSYKFFTFGRFEGRKE